jgi:hypothetical protein
MFVRWKHRRLRRSPETTLKAVLVRSVWRHGCSHQQTICYLASIRKQYQHAPAHRQAFWCRVDQCLATLPLDAPTRQRVVQQLATAVPRPTEEELQQVMAQQAVLQEMAASLAPSAPRGALGWGALGHPDGAV